MEEVPTRTLVVNTQDSTSDAHTGGEGGIEISIVNHGNVTNIVDSSGNPITSREDDVIAVLGQLFESAEETLQHMAQQISANKEPVDGSGGLKSVGKNERNRPFACECGKTYTCKSHLKYHQKVHTNIRPYVCEVCDQGFLQLGHLKRHMRIHTQDKPFACDMCDKTFRQSSHLTCHRRIHTDEKPYRCDVCGVGFRQKSAVCRHVSRMHIKEKDYVCSICRKGYSGEADLRRHEKTHVNITYFAVMNLQTNTSKICGHIQEDEMYMVDDEPLMSQENKENNEAKEPAGIKPPLDSVINDNLPVPPLSNREPRPFCCDICGKTYKSKGNLKFHSKVHLSIRPFKCPYCSKGFVQKGHLRRHVMVHTEEKPYVCTVCDKVFRQISHLNDHKKIHANLRPSVCYVCAKGFRQSSALKRHMIRMHATHKAFACGNCDKKYRLESDLKRHQATTCSQDRQIRKQTQDRQIRKQTQRARKSKRSEISVDEDDQGNEWGVQAKEDAFQEDGTEEGLSDAMPKDSSQESNEKLTKTNSKRRPYKFKCEVCEKLCRSQTDLKVHMRTHNDERPFQCGVCHNVFRLLAHLKDHMLIHTGERPFTCKVCQNKFRRNSALKRHVIRMHSKEKKHVCSVCSKAYASEVDLRRHRKTHIRDHAGLHKVPPHKKKRKKHKHDKQKHKKRDKLLGGQLQEDGNKDGGGEAGGGQAEGMELENKQRELELGHSVEPAKIQLVELQDTGADPAEDGNKDETLVHGDHVEGMQLGEVAAQVADLDSERSEKGIEACDEVPEPQDTVNKATEDGNKERVVIYEQAAEGMRLTDITEVVEVNPEGREEPAVTGAELVQGSDAVAEVHVVDQYGHIQVLHVRPEDGVLDETLQPANEPVPSQDLQVEGNPIEQELNE